MTVLDVGQGLALVINVEDQVMVYDTGAKYSENFDIGSRVLAPFLMSQGIDRANHAVISHTDMDHRGGLRGLLGAVSVDNIFSSDPIRLKQMDGVESRYCQDIENTVFKTVASEDLRVEVLWPNFAIRALTGLKENNRSCVLLIRYGERTILLTGDIEAEVEEYLLNDPRLPENIDILIAPHHGSRSSSSKALVQHLSPGHVIFSVGYKNRYRHPAATVIERYKAVNSQLWSTERDGAVTVTLSENGGVGVSAERRASAKPWF